MLNKGEKPEFIDALLKDSQMWSDLSERLQLHVSKCRKLLHDFGHKNILYEEVKKLEEANELEEAKELEEKKQSRKQHRDGFGLKPIVNLERTIAEFERICAWEISRLERHTKEMIELVST